MRRRSPYSLKGAPPTEGSRPKTRKEQYKKRTNILPLATCWRRTVCFVLPAGNFTITTRIGKRGSAGCISKDQKFRRDALLSGQHQTLASKFPRITNWEFGPQKKASEMIELGKWVMNIHFSHFWRSVLIVFWTRPDFASSTSGSDTVSSCCRPTSPGV